MSQNAETAEENAERKKKKKKEKKKKKRWRSAQDPGRARSRPATQAAVAPRDPVRCAANPGRCVTVSGFFFFFFFSFFSDEHVGATLWFFLFSF